MLLLVLDVEALELRVIFRDFVYLDNSSIEAFGNDGEVVLADLILPPSNSRELRRRMKLPLAIGCMQMPVPREIKRGLGSVLIWIWSASFSPLQAALFK